MAEPRTEPTKRQTHPWPWWRRVVRELVWASDVDDGTGDGSPSAAKMIAWLFAVLLVVSVLREKPISGTQLTWAALVVAAAFGRSMFKQFLLRGSWSAQASDATTRIDQRIRQEIAERRTQGEADGTEPTP